MSSMLGFAWLFLACLACLGLPWRALACLLSCLIFPQIDVPTVVLPFMLPAFVVFCCWYTKVRDTQTHYSHQIAGYSNILFSRQLLLKHNINSTVQNHTILPSILHYSCVFASVQRMPLLLNIIHCPWHIDPGNQYVLGHCAAYDSCYLALQLLHIR